MNPFAPPQGESLAEDDMSLLRVLQMILHHFGNGRHLAIPNFWDTYPTLPASVAAETEIRDGALHVILTPLSTTTLHDVIRERVKYDTTIN